MRKLIALLMCSGCCLTAGAETKIHLPDGVSIVPRDCLLIVTSDDPVILLQAPDAGVLKIQSVKTPWHLYERFADGDGEREYRMYDSPFVWVVTAGKPGSTELLLIPEGVTEAASIVRRVLTVSGSGPMPPPQPEPDPGPTPGPGPVTGLRVLLLGNENASREQLETMNSTAIVEWCDAHCERAADGRPEMRRWDRTSITKPDMLAKEDQIWQTLWSSISPNLPAGNLVIVAVGGKVHVQPMAGPTDTLAFLNRVKSGGQ